LTNTNKEIRCAIYTRKSTDEGLDRDFNSLDAQRESAEAFIRSQQHEGWIALPEYYDDGGFTGGNMERPALKRLLADVRAGKVDCIVVYKVDRLSRSLIDFARIIEVLEGHGATFVSVTQQFNTTHSMGRLTLNILLSFAQFEREVIAERTRDKMSAARRRGKWVGGMPVLGYDVDPRGGRLIVNETEAARVRDIFELYLKERALLPTVKELARRGWTTKRWITKKSHERGGSTFNKTNLYRFLTNAIYIGKVDYRGEIYEGEHDAIISEDVFGRVRTLLRENRRNGGSEIRNRYGALLKGLLYCGSCKTSMIHAYTSQRGKRYRYYVCSHAQKNGWDTCPVKSLPAGEIERFVIETIRTIGKDDELAAKVIREAQDQNLQAAESLQHERKFLEKELRNLDGEMRRLVKSMGQESGSKKTDRLAELQDRIQETEQRATQVREELLKTESEHIDHEKMKAALSLFDPVWDALLPKERVRVMQLLIERVVYDGENGKVSVSFRPTGIRALAFEAETTNRR
jgi:site-specific DNA recombinase